MILKKKLAYTKTLKHWIWSKLLGRKSILNRSRLTMATYILELELTDALPFSVQNSSSNYTYGLLRLMTQMPNRVLGVMPSQPQVML